MSDSSKSCFYEILADVDFLGLTHKNQDMRIMVEEVEDGVKVSMIMWPEPFGFIYRGNLMGKAFANFLRSNSENLPKIKISLFRSRDMAIFYEVQGKRRALVAPKMMTLKQYFESVDSWKIFYKNQNKDVKNFIERIHAKFNQKCQDQIDYIHAGS
uniref:Uncharacterized protein n=1 Tax=Panagrolaimus sp. JU765 TaxID=591449 RepID=A0AC34QJU6_9BILA